MRGLLRNRNGAVSIVTAVCLVMFVAFAAAAVDFGYVFLKGRQLQGIADLAAMSAASNLDNAPNAAQATADANGWSGPITSETVTGSYRPLASLPPSERFSPGGLPPNAARVTLRANADLFFAQLLLGRSALSISRTATAAQGQLASFSIGTRLASLNGGVANALLSGLTGSDVRLSLMDYNALVTAQVDLFAYVDALRTRLDLKGATFDETLSASIATGQAIGAIGDVLSASGNSGAALAIGRIASAADSTPVKIANLIDLGPYGGQNYISAPGSSGFALNALDLAEAVLGLAQGGREVKLQLASLIPGVAGVDAWLAIGERPEKTPWIAVTDDDSVVVRTAQARLFLDTRIAPLGGLSGVATVDFPLLVELASAKAKLSSLSCGASPREESVTLSIAPSIGTTAIGSVDIDALDDFNRELVLSRAHFVDTPAIHATGKAEIDLGGEAWQPVTFDADEISQGVIKTVSTDDAITAAADSLLGKLSLQVQVAGLSLGAPAVSASIQKTLTSVAKPLDGALNALEGMMGVGLGQADVWVNGVRCQSAALVQ